MRLSKGVHLAIDALNMPYPHPGRQFHRRGPQVQSGPFPCVPASLHSVWGSTTSSGDFGSRNTLRPGRASYVMTTDDRAMAKYSCMSGYHIVSFCLLVDCVRLIHASWRIAGHPRDGLASALPWYVLWRISFFDEPPALSKATSLARGLVKVRLTP